MASDEGQKVLLYVYDLSQGFAAQVSQSLLGKHVSSLKILEQNHAETHLTCEAKSYALF